MASQKEEPNTSMLFGNATDEDPFSQSNKTGANKETNISSGDVSSLFGNASAGNADLFFSSMNATANTTPQSTNPPVQSSAASFFDQPQSASDFFDNLGSQQDQQVPATASVYDYSQQQQQYDYSQQQQQQYDQSQQQQYDQSQQQQYDQSQWIQFDPNTHYYYDEQGYVHYYDPNTNQEYDMSQYGYEQQGQNYDYQYDPQYAEYYAQQGYDPNAYAQDPQQQNYAQDPNAYATTDLQQQQNYVQDPNAYVTTTDHQQQQQSYTQDAYVPEQQQQQIYAQDNYDPDAYAPSVTQQDYYDYSTQASNAVAEMPAQVQAEETTDTQDYASNQQDPYGQTYATTDVQQAENKDPFTSTDYLGSHYAQLQNELETEDLQQPSQVETGPSAPLAETSPPPQQNIMSPTHSNLMSPSQDYQVEQEPPHQENSKPEDLDELDDLVLGGLSLDKAVSKPAPSFDTKRLSITSDDQKIPHIPLSNEPMILESDPEPNLTQHKDSGYEHEQNYKPTSYAPVQNTAYEFQQTTDYEPQQVPVYEEIKSYEPQDAAKFEELNNYESLQLKSYEPQQTTNYEPKQDTSYESQQLHSYEPQQSASYEPQQLNSYEPQQAASYEPQQLNSYEPQQAASYESQQLHSYEPQQAASYEPQQLNSYEPQQAASYESQQLNSYEPYQTSGYEPLQTTAYEPQQTTSYESQQLNDYEPQQTASYEPQQTTSYESQQTNIYESQQVTGYEPQQLNNYEAQQLASYEPQQTTSYEPQQISSYEPQETTAYEPQQINGEEQQEPIQTANTGSADVYQYGYYQPQQTANYEPVKASMPVSSPPPSGPPKNQQVVPPPPMSTKRVSSPPPPPRAGSIGSVSSVPPRANSIHSHSSIRPNSISSPPTAPNRSQSPFGAHYNPPAAIERSATVPPPMTERIASPRPQLVSCPDPQCEGENKPKAKFCCECGRPLAGISRSTTPAANMHMEPFPTVSFGTVAEQMQRNLLDDIRDSMKTTLTQFIPSSVLVHADRHDLEKQQLALDYIQRRLPTFEESKALLWNVVKLMLEHHENVLGDGGSLDKSIIQLIIASEERTSMTRLDELEDMLLDGDREKACEFASSHDMWGHSFIIATGKEDLFKRTMAKFIQRELFSSSDGLVPQVTGDNKALRLLYSAINGAGNNAVTEFLKEAVDDEGAYTEDSLKGWKRALALVLANRTPDDQKVIRELGNQLETIASKTNEAQLCYLLSPEGNSILNNTKHADLDGLILAELYEFASKAKIQQDYKLLMAWWLSELGFTEESKKYCDAIIVDSASLDELKRLGDIPATSSNDSTSLLSKENFDLLIHSLDVNPNLQISDSGYGGYGYGYDNNFSVATETPTAVTSTFSQPKGIQSPFQANQATQPVSSPFGLQQNPPNAVSSPFGQPYTANEVGSSWWDSNNAESTTNKPEESSYEPETSYQPPAVESSTSFADDDDLGFDNNKTKKSVESTTRAPEPETTTVVEEKPKENNSEPKEKSGWGLFSLFGRNKESNTEEKKAVKANLGGTNNFYFDEKEKRWVNKLNDVKPAAATPPPPPKSMTPQLSSASSPSPPTVMKPNSMPPPTIGGPLNGGPPHVAPPSFNTPPVSSRRGAGGKKSMRSRYVDVLNQN